MSTFDKRSAAIISEYDMTVAAVLKCLGWHDVAVHNFRSSFRDWPKKQLILSNGN